MKKSKLPNDINLNGDLSPKPIKGVFDASSSEAPESILQKITQKYPNEIFLKTDDYDDAIIGVDENSMRLVYSVSKCIDILVKGGMKYEEAVGSFDYSNINNTFGGLQPPIWCFDLFLDEK
jgi:hypothetical protein